MTVILVGRRKTRRLPHIQEICLNNAFMFFAWFPLKIKFILSFCECVMRGVSIRPFFFFFIFSVRYLENGYHIEKVSSRGGSVGI